MCKWLFNLYSILLLALNCMVQVSAFTSVNHTVDLVQTYSDSLSISHVCQDEQMCRRRTFENVTSCVTSGVCSATNVCNGRVNLPPIEYPLQNLVPANNREGCRVTDEMPVSPPFSTSQTYASNLTLMVNSSADGLSSCYVRKSTVPGDVFTVSFWLTADCSNCSVLELPQTTGQSIHIRGQGDNVCVNQDVNFCLSSNVSSSWIRVTVRVINDQMTLFLGTDAHPVTDKVANVGDIQNLFVGSTEITSDGDTYSIFDVRYYSDALTSREIQRYLMDGTPSPVVEEPDCRCLHTFPDPTSQDPNVCTDGTATFPRFNTTIEYNAPSAVTDRDAATNWASADSGQVNMTIDFKATFLVGSVVISFDQNSELPGSASCIFILEGSESMARDLLCEQNMCTLDIALLNSSVTRQIYESRRADSLKIVLQHTDDSTSRSFIVTDLAITGSCDCNGNAETCTSDKEDDYTCTCLPDTHTTGSNCELCASAYFRQAEGNFECANSCDCDTSGTNTSTGVCEEIGGQCPCKSNVEGRTCNKCKYWHHSLSASDPDGCTPCQCDQVGSETCSDDDGTCSCKPNVQPPFCAACQTGMFNVSDCQSCGCDTAGTKGQSTSCSEHDGQCDCKDNVHGRKCDVCKPGYYKLDTANAKGCTSCMCNIVGVSGEQCDHVTGQCQCRGGVVTDSKCRPKISRVHPRYGPLNGGTMVTVFGQLLGNTTHPAKVFIQEKEQTIVSRSDEMIVFKTRSNSQLGYFNIKLSWADIDAPLDLGSNFNFGFRPIPVLDMTDAQGARTYVSGGCMVPIKGTNLASVKFPLLEISNSDKPFEEVSEVCRHLQEHVYCPTPNIRSIFNTNNSQYLMKIVFDGVTSEMMDIKVFQDPSFESNKNVEFEYPFERTIKIDGARINSACQDNVYTVLIGVIQCGIKDLEDTYLKCEPPASRPDGAKKHKLTVAIGNIKHTVGTLEYMDFHETTGFIIIMCCLAGVILIILAVVIYCCYFKTRRNRSNGNPYMVKNDRKSLVPQEQQNRQMNVYSDLSAANANQGARANPAVNGHDVFVETMIKEPKRGIVNSSAEEAVLIEEFLPHVEPSLREEVRVHHVGRGHFNMARNPRLRGSVATLIDGTLQKNGAPVSKLTIKSLTGSLTGTSDSLFPTWANQALAECLRLKRHNHPNVLSIQGIGIEPQRFHILYPCMAKGTLKQIVSDTSQEFSLRQLLGFGQQVLDGLTFLSSTEITHKDVAARNCMMDDNMIVKLGDAALSWDFYKEEYVYDDQRERYLPLRWMAPESITDGFYDNSTDVWSFGILIWELLTRGCLPFHEVTDPGQVKEYILEGYVLGKPDTMSDELYSILTECWSLESETRPALSAISRSLNQILEGDEEIYANTQAVGSTFPHSPRRMQGNGKK